MVGRVTRSFTHVGSGNDLSVDDKVGHGTTVASLAAGSAFGQWPGGVASGANIVSSRIIADKVGKGTCAIVGVTYALSDGRMRLQGTVGDVGETATGSESGDADRLA